MVWFFVYKYLFCRWKSILSAAVSRSTSQTEKSEPGDTEIIKAGIMSSDQNLDKVGKKPEPRDSDELAPRDSKSIPVKLYQENSPKLAKKGKKKSFILKYRSTRGLDDWTSRGEEKYL